MKQQGFIVLGVSAVVLMVNSLACCFSIPIAGRRVFPDWESVRGSGDVIEETREVRNFNRVALATFEDLYIEQGEEEALRIEAEDNIMSYIEIELDAQTLRIGTESNVTLRPTKPVRFYLTVKELDAIVLSGSGDVEAPGLKVADFSVTVAGSGNVYAQNLTADHLTVQVAGSGNADVSGEVNRQEITISGSGDYEARDLESAEAKVQIGGSGMATIWVSDSLDVTIGGSGSVRYAGIPEVTSSVTGSGSLRQVGD